VPASGTAELTAPAPGTYAYHCNIHGSMTGTLTVEG
jgi:plastocyanin